MDMKKIVAAFLSVSTLCLNGCMQKDTHASSSVKETIHTWHVLPEIEISSLQALVPFSQQTIRNGEREAAMLENQNGTLNQFGDTGYTDNALLLQKDDIQMIYDYDGNLLYTTPDKLEDTYLSEGIVAAYGRKKSDENYFSIVYGTRVSNEKAYILNASFTSQDEIAAQELILHPYDGNQVFDQIAIKNGKIGILYHLKNKAGEDAAGYGFEECDVPIGDMCFAEKVNSNNEPLKQVVIDKQGNIISEVPSEVNVKSYGTFVNGFYSCYQKTDNDKKLAVIDARSGKAITEYQYKSVGYFENGYCPVQNRNGKWAYINANGEEVTDFLFDSASAIYEGKAWVCNDGKAGILNIDASKNGKLTNAIFSEQSCDTPVKAANVEEKEESETVIGTVNVNISTLNIRKTPSLSADKVGVASLTTYDVFEKSDADGYTWYKIGDNEWIAGNNEWVTYTEK